MFPALLDLVVQSFTSNLDRYHIHAGGRIPDFLTGRITRGKGIHVPRYKATKNISRFYGSIEQDQWYCPLQTGASQHGRDNT